MSKREAGCICPSSSLVK
jgi:uncharacterized protein YjbJ (UPF0337 family)